MIKFIVDEFFTINCCLTSSIININILIITMIRIDILNRIIEIK